MGKFSSKFIAMTVGIVALFSAFDAKAVPTVPTEILDFTVFKPGGYSTGAYSLTEYTLTSTGGSVVSNGFYRGNTCDSGVLDCGVSGLGVSLGDEINGGILIDGETLTITFGGDVSINGLFFLQLYKGESAEVFYEGGSQIFNGTEKLVCGLFCRRSGYLFEELNTPIITDFLTFTAPGSAFNDYSLAAISGASVTAVPLPAALPLHGTGLAVMGLLGMRRKRKQNATL